MIRALDADTWSAILADVDEPTVDAVAQLLAGRFHMDHGHARDELTDATADASTPVATDGDETIVVDVDEPAGEPDTDDTGAGGSDAGDDDVEPADGVALASGREFYPDALVSRPWWTGWVRAHPFGDDGAVAWGEKPTKQPVAPYDHGHARPVKWNFDLPDDEHPCTSLDRVEPWAGMSTTVDLAAPDRVVSDTVGSGIILPRGQAAGDDRTILLIDWDDVRDPSDGSIHPVVRRALDECDGYAEISQSGEGIHQFVYAEVPGSNRTFIRHIDDEPFVGDDLPALEIYQSGRVCAMTGRHVDGTGDDVVGGQDMIDRLCWEFGAADNAGPGTPTDPYADERDAGDVTDTDADRSNAGVVDVPDHDTVGRALDELAAFDDDDPDEWEYPDDWSLRYAAIVRARGRSDELAGISNWTLNGYAATVGYHDGRDRGDVVDDLAAVCDDESLEKEVGQMWRKADVGDYKPPSRSRLAKRGLLPDRFDRDGAADEPARDNQLIVLPDVDDEPDAGGDGLEDTDTDTTALDDVDEPAHGHLTVDYARARTKARLVDAYTGDDDVLLEALPSMGKSYGSVAAAVETGRPTTILVGRGNNEQYGRIREWCRDHGLDVGDKREPNGDVYILPSFKRDCETANGDHGDEWADTVDAWYQAGATPKKIHKIGPYALDDDDRDALPCQAGDASCGYTRRWDFDPDDFDVLIGHYTHAHKPKVTTDRVVVVDEFTGAYETELASDELADAINQYLSEHGVGDGLVSDDRDGGYLAFQTFSDLLLNRDDPDRRDPAVEWLRNRGVASDEDGAIYFDGDGDETPNAAAPLAIYTILKSTTLGNGYERVEFRPDVDDDKRIGVFDDGRDRLDGKPGVSILRPPAGFDYADVVVGLDGTPTPAMWELACGRAFDHRTVLKGRRAEYLTDALGFRILPTTDALKPYNNPDYINTDHDAALLEAIAKHHDTKPAVITSATAVGEWDDAGVIDLARDDDGRPTGDVEHGPVDRVRWHGNVLGSNAFGETRVGAVIGSNHYGDGFVKRWGAYAGEAVTREHADGDADPDTKPRGSDLSYGAFGDEIYRHMTEADTLQAVMRFGRDAGGASVYVDTDTLPKWVPTAGRGDVRAVSDGLVGVLDALEDVGPASAADLAAHDAVDVSTRQVHTHLETLADYGVVASTTDPDDGRRTIYGVDDDTGVTATGVVDLPDAGDWARRTRPWSRPTGVYDTAKVREVSRIDQSIYVRLHEDRDEPDDVATDTTTAGDELESGAGPPSTPGETLREVTPPALPDGGVVRFDLTTSYDDEPAVLEYDIKKDDAAGEPWYLTSDRSSTPTRHRRGARPATRRRSRPSALPDRGAGRGRTPTRGPLDVDGDDDRDDGGGTTE